MYHSILSIGKYRKSMPVSSYMHNDAWKLATGPNLERDYCPHRCSRDWLTLGVLKKTTGQSKYNARGCCLPVGSLTPCLRPAKPRDYGEDTTMIDQMAYYGPIWLWLGIGEADWAPVGNLGGGPRIDNLV